MHTLVEIHCKKELASQSFNALTKPIRYDDYQIYAICFPDTYYEEAVPINLGYLSKFEKFAC